MLRKNLRPILCAAFVIALATNTPSKSFASASIFEISVDHGIPLTLNAPAASVFIANPDIADVQVMSPTSIMVFGKKTGETTFMATDNNGKTLSERTIRVVQDLMPLRQELDHSFPGNKIKVASVPNGIVMTGEAKDPASVADAYKLAQRYIPAQGGDIINRIHVVGSNQIMIRVRFAEVERSVDNTLGIDWNSAASYGGMVFGFASGADFYSTAAASITGITRPTNSSLALPNDVTSIQSHGKRLSLNGIIDALAQDGLVSILAEPTLTAMSGETANFLAGGEFPIVVPQGGGASVTYSVQFKAYGISLAFTPTLISENRISLHVKPEVSELTQTGAVTLSNISIPALKTRRAETTVEVGSGESFAIAGLMDNTQAETVNKYPLLGDIPVLGNLFRSNHFQTGQTELVVIITPYIVKPTANQLALPMDGLTAPSEIDRLWKQRYSNSDPNARPMSGQPTAVQIEAPHAEIDPTQSPAEAAAPLAAPVAPVNKTPVLINPPPVNAAPTSLTPVGPGGFMLE